jgi:hypothetical protein
LARAWVGVSSAPGDALAWEVLVESLPSCEILFTTFGVPECGTSLDAFVFVHERLVVFGRHDFLLLDLGEFLGRRAREDLVDLLFRKDLVQHAEEVALGGFSHVFEAPPAR